MQETRVPFLGQEYPLEEEMATHSNILAWKIPWIEELGRLHSLWGCKELDMTELMMNICHLIHVSKPIESVTTSKVNSGGSCGLWMILCQYGFISCNKCITLVWDIDQGKGYACWGQGGWKISVPSCCEPKIGNKK